MVELRVEIVGCGTIGNYVAKAIDGGIIDADLVVVFDADVERATRLAEGLARSRPRVARSIEELVSKDVDVVVEAASQEAVRMYAARILRSGKDLVVLSVGALLDEELRRIIAEAARAGAIGSTYRAGPRGVWTP